MATHEGKKELARAIENIRAINAFPDVEEALYAIECCNSINGKKCNDCIYMNGGCTTPRNITVLKLLFELCNLRLERGKKEEKAELTKEGDNIEEVVRIVRKVLAGEIDG